MRRLPSRGSLPPDGRARVVRAERFDKKIQHFESALKSCQIRSGGDAGLLSLGLRSGPEGPR